MYPRERECWRCQLIHLELSGNYREKCLLWQTNLALISYSSWKSGDCLCLWPLFEYLDLTKKNFPQRYFHSDLSHVTGLPKHHSLPSQLPLTGLKTFKEFCLTPHICVAAQPGIICIFINILLWAPAEPTPQTKSVWYLEVFIALYKILRMSLKPHLPTGSVVKYNSILWKMK